MIRVTLCDGNVMEIYVDGVLAGRSSWAGEVRRCMLTLSNPR